MVAQSFAQVKWLIYVNIKIQLFTDRYNFAS